MGIFGTILGGTLGFMIGGPVGAVLGGVLGSQASAGVQAARVQGGMGRMGTAQRQQITFAVALTSLAAKVAKADGQVTGDEVRAYDAFLQNSLHLSRPEREFAAQVFNQARDSTTPAGDFARQLATVFAGQTDRLRDVLTILLLVAYADGHLHPAEEQLLQSIGRDMGLTAADYDSCKATFLSATGKQDVDPYEVLGVSRDASDDELKAAHRRLVRDYHPDKIQAKGLPEDFQDFAAQKMTAINEAWAMIRQQRQL